METLNGVLKGGAIDLIEYVGAHLDDVIRPYSKEKLVEGSMMQPAERYPVANYWFPLRFRVRDDMGGVQQLPVAESTEGTLISIGSKDTLPECTLMQSSPRQGRDVLPAHISNLTKFPRGLGKEIGMDSIVNGDGENKSFRGVMDHIHRLHY